MIVVVMGVAGSGKTTIGRQLAAELGWPFFDADDFHPPANIEKMRRGEALSDADRVDWLEALQTVLRQPVGVLACSALKQTYRDQLTGTRFVYLKADRELLQRRLDERREHFFPPGLLDSQLATLEEPGDAIVVGAGKEPGEIVRAIRAALNL